MLAWSGGKLALQMKQEAAFPGVSLQISVAWWAQIAIPAQTCISSKSWFIPQEILFISV